MAIDTHYRQMFSDNVKELAGSPQRSLYKGLCSQEAKQGELIWLDSYAPTKTARSTAIASTKTRKRLEDAGSPDLADWVALKTPHMEITRQRTQLSATCVDWGHHFDSETKLLEILDPQSRIMRACMKDIWIAEDALVRAALAAATVTRGKQGATSSVAFPATQQLTIDKTASPAGSVTKDIFAEIKKLFETQYYTGRILVAVSPLFKQELIENSGDKIHSSDFVDGRRYFETGELPDIYGCSVLVDPGLTIDGDTGEEPFYAWAMEGLVWNQFAPLLTRLGEDPGERFHAIAYAEEYAGCVRVDDNLVVQGTVKRGEDEY